MVGDIIRAIEEAESILILTHVNPDGDAIGSSYALKKGLQSLGKTVYAVTEEPLSDYFSMFRHEFICMDDFFGEYDLVIAVDTGDTKRLGKCIELFKNETAVIDHHETNEGYGKYNYIDGDSASCGEIITDFLWDMNIYISSEIATALYAAMLTDTGGFIYQNTTAETHKKAARLIEAGADYALMNRKLIEEKSFEFHKVSAALINKMEFFKDGKICVAVLDYDYCVKNNITKDCLNGLASLPRTVSGVDTGVLISEVIKGQTKVSLRTDVLTDAAEVALKFGGGGHKRAAGFTTEEYSPLEIKEKLVAIISEGLEEK